MEHETAAAAQVEPPVDRHHGTLPEHPAEVDGQREAAVGGSVSSGRVRNAATDIALVTQTPLGDVPTLQPVTEVVQWLFGSARRPDRSQQQQSREPDRNTAGSAPAARHGDRAVVLQVRTDAIAATLFVPA